MSEQSDIEYTENDELKGKVQSHVFETSRYLGIILKDIKVFNPPPEDLSDDAILLGWTAIIDAVAEEPTISRTIEGFRVGGRLSWPYQPKDTEIEYGVRRSVSFSLLAGIAPEREFIYQALEASLWSQNSVLLGAFIHESISLMQAGMGNIKNSSQVPTPLKVMKLIGDKLNESALEVLNQVRQNLKAQFDGKPLAGVHLDDKKVH